MYIYFLSFIFLFFSAPLLAQGMPGMPKNIVTEMASNAQPLILENSPGQELVRTLANALRDYVGHIADVLDQVWEVLVVFPEKMMTHYGVSANSSFLYWYLGWIVFGGFFLFALGRFFGRREERAHAQKYEMYFHDLSGMALLVKQRAYYGQWLLYRLFPVFVMSTGLVGGLFFFPAPEPFYHIVMLGVGVWAASVFFLTFMNFYIEYRQVTRGYTVLTVFPARMLGRLLIGIGGLGVFFTQGFEWLGEDFLSFFFMKLTLIIILMVMIFFVFKYKKKIRKHVRSVLESWPKERSWLKTPLLMFNDLWPLITLFTLSSLLVMVNIYKDIPIVHLSQSAGLTVVLFFLTRSLRGMNQYILYVLLALPLEVERNFPYFARRYHRYMKSLEMLIRIAAYATVSFFALKIWNIDLTDFFHSNLVQDLIHVGSPIFKIIFFFWLLKEIIENIVNYLVHKGKKEKHQRLLTIMPVVFWTVRIILLIFMTLLILAHLGINTGPIITLFGFVGFGLTFGLQGIIKDVISGVVILLENSIAVGEIVQIDDLKGLVEKITIRAVFIRSKETGAVHTIPFSAIIKFTNYSRLYTRLDLECILSGRLDMPALYEMANRMNIGLHQKIEIKKKIARELMIDRVEDMAGPEFKVVFKMALKSDANMADVQEVIVDRLEKQMAFYRDQFVLTQHEFQVREPQAMESEQTKKNSKKKTGQKTSLQKKRVVSRTARATRTKPLRNNRNREDEAPNITP